MSTTGENAQQRATVTPADRLGWQSELDSAMVDIDHKLSHPRRRASDAASPPSQLGQVNITNELLDEIAWRVAQQMRRNQPATVAMEAAAPAVAADVTAPAVASEPERLPAGIAVTIRLRRPLFRFRWRFWRRRQKAMMLFSDYRVS